MIHNYQRLLGSNLMITFLLCIIFSPLLLHGQMTALINYQYYSPSSNYSSITEENRTNGIVSTRGSHAPIYNRQAFLLMDVQNAYDACRQPINTLKYPNGIAIIHRGGDCTFSVKITRAKQYGAAAVIIYDPRSNNQDVFDMLQNDSNILALYVPRSIGSVLFNLTNDSQTYLNISLLPTNIDYEDPNRKGLWYSSRGAIIFVAISICILVCLFISWFIFYYCQRYRSRTAKDHLQNRLTNAAKKALTKIPLITITATPPIEESCVICLDAIKAGDIVRQLKCTHTFHQTCVDPWLINHRHCPLCNLDILAAYSISIPGTTTRRHAVEPEQSMPMSYTSLATTAAPRVFEQNNSPRNEQSRQTSVNIQHPPIPTISGSLRDDIHGEQNSLFRMDNDH